MNHIRTKSEQSTVARAVLYNGEETERQQDFEKPFCLKL